MEKAYNGNYICQFNPECECKTPECHKCGWNPEVAERRLKDYREAQGLPGKKYKVPFAGYSEVWANSPEEAKDKVGNGNMFFIHHCDFGEPECLSKEEEDEVD